MNTCPVVTTVVRFFKSLPRAPPRSLRLCANARQHDCCCLLLRAFAVRMDNSTLLKLNFI
jgi:hypothetical protein